MTITISVFTLNCWGIGMGVSKNRKVRMRAIGQHLADSQYDIVCLQVRVQWLHSGPYTVEGLTSTLLLCKVPSAPTVCTVNIIAWLLILSSH